MWILWCHRLLHRYFGGEEVAREPIVFRRQTDHGVVAGPVDCGNEDVEFLLEQCCRSKHRLVKAIEVAVEQAGQHRVPIGRNEPRLDDQLVDQLIEAGFGVLRPNQPRMADVRPTQLDGGLFDTPVLDRAEDFVPPQLLRQALALGAATFRSRSEAGRKMAAPSFHFGQHGIP